MSTALPTHPATFFLALGNNVKLYHWMTTSFARHTASDKLFDAILEHSDKFVEVYIGRYGRPRLSKKDLSPSLHFLTDNTIVAYLDSVLAYLNKGLMDYISEKDTDLVNIRDEIIAEVNQAKYLFTLH